MKGLKLVPKGDAMHSPVALTFDAEIKRWAASEDIDMARLMEQLARMTGLDERQLYNYRQGKTDIPALLIPIFCRQFKSNALAMAVLGMCEPADFDADDAFDIAKLCAGVTQDMLKGSVAFMEAFEDNRISGHELVALKSARARICRDVNRLMEIATAAHERRAA